MDQADIKRFWSHVAIGAENECWSWKLSRHIEGYGRFRIKGKTDRAHRIAWIIKNGNIPKGKIIRHTCDNPPCCNPKHLLCGTQSDNIMDILARHRRPRTQIGTLYALQIQTIRMLKHSEFYQDTIAAAFKTSPAQVSRMWDGREMICREGYYI